MTQYTQKLFVLEASGEGRRFTINPDGSEKTFIVTGCPVPDGVAVDVQAGHIYWTDMGAPPVNFPPPWSSDASTRARLLKSFSTRLSATHSTPGLRVTS